MRKYGKWLLVLGILAANPAWAHADGLLSGLRPSMPQSKTVQKQENLQRAQQVMNALKQARVDGYDVRVEVRGDTVKIDGKVRNVNHRALAEQASQKVNGISRVLNNLKYVPSGNVQQTAGRYTDNALRPATYNVVDKGESGIQQVHFQKPGKRKPTAQKTVRSVPRRTSTPTRRPQPQPQQQAAQPWTSPPPVAPEASLRPKTVAKAPATTFALTPPAVPPVSAKPVAAPEIKIPAPQPEPVNPLDMTAAMMPQDLQIPAPVAKPAGPSNQQVAQNIASSLGEVGLVGYEIEVRYENGVAHLVGEVPSAQQIQAAGFAASRVPGVKSVKNDLKIGSGISQTAFTQGGYPQGMPVGYPGPQQYPQAQQASMGMPMGGMGGAGAPSPIAGAGNYSNPQLPSHAWPAYAQYPNSAAVSYPKQHSASAFPYIGPFYPYPQVPLGWREVSLQWDDGYWQLDFEQKKDAWYWLWNPKNWN